MVQVEWDPLGRLVQVTVADEGPFDATLARKVVERLERFTRGQERALLLVDARALRQGTPEWSEIIVGFLVANRDRFRIALYGARETLGDLRAWASSVGLEVAAFDTRNEAGLWLMERTRSRL